jgi:hypothetical protein
MEKSRGKKNEADENENVEEMNILWDDYSCMV